MKKEYILCAANWYNDSKIHPHQPKNIAIGFVICGRRHHNIINTLSSVFDFGHADVAQGFITSQDRWVNRMEAQQIAIKADQILDLTKLRGLQLYSEDLY